MAEAKKQEANIDQLVNDYKLIKGIGPAVEKRLHHAGFLSYAQLAALKPNALIELLNGMVGYSVERIEEQDWIGQANKLANKAGQAPEEVVSKPSNNSLHYASYTLELLLDTENNVRRTRAMHVQSRQESSWAGWNFDKFLSFLLESGELNDKRMIAEHSTVTKHELPVATRPAKPVHEMLSSPAWQLIGNARVTETILHSPKGQRLGSQVPSREPFVVHLELDLSQLEVPNGEELVFDANIYKKRIDETRRECIGSLEGTLPKADRAVIEIESEPLHDGDYRLEAIVAVRPQSQSKELKHQLIAMSEGMLLHVF